jgi:predicted transcriptional regulator
VASTTEDAVYDDNANRSIELRMDESAPQDEAIMAYQRKVLAGKIDTGEQENTRALLQHAQRLLEPCRVVNPYAELLQLPDSVYKKRRTNMLYLQLVAAIAFLHQHQRRVSQREGSQKAIWVEATDIRAANKLFAGLLVQKSDSLNSSCRQFFEDLKTWLEKEERETFTQKQLATALRQPTSTAKRHVRTLMEQGLVSITGGDRYKKGYTYTITDDEAFARIREQVEETLDSSLKAVTAEKEAMAKVVDQVGQQ